MDALAAELKRRGVAFLRDLAKDYDEDTKSCYIRDNNRNLTRLVRELE